MTLAFNIFITWWCWYLSQDAFAVGRPGWGWAMLIVSAGNAAALLSNLI